MMHGLDLTKLSSKYQERNLKLLKKAKEQG